MDIIVVIIISRIIWSYYRDQSVYDASELIGALHN
jgi:hypothetical protein